VRRQGDHAYTALFEKVLWPTWDVAVRRRETRRHLLELERSQWLDPEVRERAELRSLIDLLTYAGREVPYYRELFRAYRFEPRGVRSSADLAALPLLTRDIIRERYDDLVDLNHRGKNLKKGTSGSTGNPMAEVTGKVAVMKLTWPGSPTAPRLNTTASAVATANCAGATSTP